MSGRFYWGSYECPIFERVFRVRFHDSERNPDPLGRVSCPTCKAICLIRTQEPEPEPEVDDGTA